jgi:hypothetical protein
MVNQRDDNSGREKTNGPFRSAGQRRGRHPVRLLFPPPSSSGRDDAVRGLISGGLARLVAEYIASNLRAMRNPVPAHDELTLPGEKSHTEYLTGAVTRRIDH